MFDLYPLLVLPRAILSKAFIVVFCLTAQATSTLVLNNITVPDGTMYKPKYSLLCLAAKPSDVFIFFAANYLAHAATVKSFPGENSTENIKSLLFALLFPSSGIVRGLDAIFRHAMLTKHPLQRAARAGALCMVVRSNEWTPFRGCVIKDYSIMDGVMDEAPRRSRVREHLAPDEQQQNGGVELNQIQPQPQSYRVYTPRWMTEYLTDWIYCDTLTVYVPPERKVHGLGSLPPGYRLAYVPRDAVVAFKWDEDPPIPDNSHAPSWSLHLMLQKISNFAQATGIAVKSWFRSLFRGGPKEQETSGGVIASSYALPKALIALFQLVYGAISLTNTRGDQVSKFGYASFGLTVAAYTVMAFINLVGHLLTPDYSALFVVQNEVLEEILNGSDHDKRFADGVVGRLIPADEGYRSSNHQPRRIFNGKFTNPATFQVNQTDDGESAQSWALSPPGTPGVKGEPIVQIPACPLFKRKLQLYEMHPSLFTAMTWMRGLLSEAPDQEAGGPAPGPRPREFHGLVVYSISVLFLALICFTIIATFSKLANYDSTSAQRGWTMSWFICGMVAGYSMPLGGLGLDSPVRYSSMNIDNLGEAEIMREESPAVLALVWMAPTIGGFVVVAQMINAYGNCIKLN